MNQIGDTNVDKISPVVGVLGLLLAITTFFTGDGVLHQSMPALPQDEIRTIIHILCIGFFAVSLVATALFFVSRMAPNINMAMALYLCFTFVVLGCATFWDGFTTLVGIQKILTTMIPANKSAAILMAFIATFIMYFCFILPCSFVLGGNFHPFQKLMYFVVYALTSAFDFFTLVVGNATIIFQLSDPKTVLQQSFYTEHPAEATTLFVITFIVVISPTTLSILLHRLKNNNE